MTETTWATLRQLLAERYDEFRHRLTRRLGSDERARETLHETWLHLHGTSGPGVVRSPTGYLLRAALNLATDRERRETRKARRFEVGAMLDMVDEAPGPDRAVEARQQVALLEQVLEELTPRRRMILLASRLEGIPLSRIADHLGLSQRFVEIELRAALEHCARRFGRRVTRRFGPAPRKTSVGRGAGPCPSSPLPAMPREIHRPMTEFGNSSEELDPLESEALVRVRCLGSGRATSRDIEDTKRWGRQSAAHAEALAQASLLWDRLGPAGHNLLKRSGEPVLPDWAPASAPPRFSRRAAIAGTLAAAAAGYLVMRPPLGLWPSLTDVLADYRTAVGEQRKLTIGGGVQVTLNTETSLNVQSHGGDTDRLEVVTGEVLVATTAAFDREVVVIVGDGQARAQQARFDVRHDRQVTCVACLDGIVEVERYAKISMLRTGQQVVYAAQGLTPPRSVDPARISAWQDGLLIFHYMPLVDVVAELNRYRPGRIFVVNPELGRRLVNGRFRIDNIDSIMAIFQRIFDARMTRLPGGVILLS